MATKKTGAPGKAAPLDPKIADKLLDKLSTDNEFRRLFKKDPAAALAKVGHKVAGNALVGGCMQTNHIAPKAEILKSRELIKQSLTGTAAYSVVFAFESGEVAKKLSRK